MAPAKLICRSCKKAWPRAVELCPYCGKPGRETRRSAPAAKQETHDPPAPLASSSAEQQYPDGSPNQSTRAAAPVRNESDTRRAETPKESIAAVVVTPAKTATRAAEGKPTNPGAARAKPEAAAVRRDTVPAAAVANGPRGARAPKLLTYQHRSPIGRIFNAIPKVWFLVAGGLFLAFGMFSIMGLLDRAPSRQNPRVPDHLDVAALPGQWTKLDLSTIPLGTSLVVSSNGPFLIRSDDGPAVEVEGNELDLGTISRSNTKVQASGADPVTVTVEALKP